MRAGLRSLMFLMTMTVTGGCKLAPSLRVDSKGSSIVVDVQSFGEYGTEIRRIRLTDRTEDRVIWEVVAQKQIHPSLHTFTLSVGANPTKEWRDGYDLVVPRDGDSFFLEKAREYLIEVWSGEGKWTRSYESFQTSGP